MAKMKLDPKKMEVVKKTVTVAAPTGGIETAVKKAFGSTASMNPKNTVKAMNTPIAGKTKGGVPLDPKARAKFYDDEISRFSGLIREYANQAGLNAPNKKLSAEYLKKRDDAKKMQQFLIEQSVAFGGQQEAEKKRKEDIIEAEAYNRQQEARPVMTKVRDAMRTIGGSGYMRR